MSDPQKPNGAPVPGPSSPLVQQPQYEQDFTGMSTAPFSDEARRILAETPDHDAVEVKPDGICFMPGVWYRRQLTRAFGAGAWALKPNGPVKTVGNSVEWSGALYILGRWVAEAVGGQESSAWMSHADSIQGAKTDCLSKCCGHGLAMASELWDKTWREAWMDRYTDKTWQEPKDGKKGKWVYKLKEKRAPQAADLMRDVPTSSTTAVPSAAPTDAVPAPKIETTTATPTAAASATSSPVDPITANARKAVKGQMKRLGFTATEAKTWLTKYFGVAKVDLLDDTFQLDDAHDLLSMLSPDDQDPPAKYVATLDNLHANGRVLAKS